MRSTIERQPFGGKHFHCSVCRASHLWPLVLAGPKMLFAIYVIIKSCVQMLLNRLCLPLADKDRLGEKCCIPCQASSEVGVRLLSLTDCWKKVVVLSVLFM